MKIFSWISPLLMALGLQACNNYGLDQIVPGETGEARVRQIMGIPTGEFPEADGGLTLEYSGQPAGIVCHMIHLDGNRVVTRVEQVLDEPGLARIQAGQDKDRVRRLLGKPASIQFFQLKNEEVWDWHIKGEMPGEMAYFHVHFDGASGLVTRTSRRIEPRG